MSKLSRKLDPAITTRRISSSGANLKDARMESLAHFKTFTLRSKRDSRFVL